MKNFARMALFFSVSFVLLFLFASLLRFLALWIDAARIIPLESEYSANLISALTWAVPVTLYAAILLALSYSARRKMPVTLSIITIMFLSGAFTLGASLGIRQIKGVNFALEAAPAVRDRPGLILSRPETAVILLKGGGDLRGPRVVSFAGQPLLYQETPRGPNNSVLSLPSLPFPERTPWFIRSILIDFTLCARQFDARLLEGLIPFGMYAGALIFLLASLRFLLGLSNWPLANIFLGALVFRGILGLETFLNTKEMQYLISSFLGMEEILPLSWITPLVFCCLGMLVVLYTFLSYLARGKGARR